MNFANSKRFSHFQLGTHVFHFAFSVKIFIGYLQSHLLYLSNSLFESDIKKAFGLKNFFKAQNFYIYKAAKIVVNCKYENLIFTIY